MHPGFGYEKMNETKPGQKAFVFLYCLANYTTTFIIPGEVFPTRYRSTAHGICAASGKLGAIIAQVGFARMRDIGGTDKFVKHIGVDLTLFHQSRNIRFVHADGHLLDGARDEE